MDNKTQHWGVVIGEGKEAEIVAVYKDYDNALQESMFFTHETQIQHRVMPVVPKKKGENK